MDKSMNKRVKVMEGSLFSSPRKAVKDVQLKYLVIGDFGVGKTAIVRRYVEGGFSSNYKITIGADFTLKSMLWDDKTRIQLQLWDIAGHERFGHMTRVYYKNAVAALIVFDLTRTATIASVKKWLLDLRDKVTQPDGSPVPVILLANKCDVPGSTLPKDTISRMCKDYNIDGWFATSAKENVNIDEAFNFLIRKSLQLNVQDATSYKKEEIVLINKPIFDKRAYEDRHFCC